MKDQMIRVISSPLSSTTGFLTAIFATRRAMLPMGWHNQLMATVERRSAATHEVFNQATPLEDYNSFDADQVLQEALQREGGGWAAERARELGAIAGSAQTIRW